MNSTNTHGLACAEFAVYPRKGGLTVTMKATMDDGTESVDPEVVNGALELVRSTLHHFVGEWSQAPTAMEYRGAGITVWEGK